MTRSSELHDTPLPDPIGVTRDELAAIVVVIGDYLDTLEGAVQLTTPAGIDQALTALVHVKAIVRRLSERI